MLPVAAETRHQRSRSPGGVHHTAGRHGDQETAVSGGQVSYRPGCAECAAPVSRGSRGPAGRMERVRVLFTCDYPDNLRAVPVTTAVYEFMYLSVCVSVTVSVLLSM